jgi:hypothetical protein
MDVVRTYYCVIMLSIFICLYIYIDVVRTYYCVMMLLIFFHILVEMLLKYNAK